MINCAAKTASFRISTSPICECMDDTPLKVAVIVPIYNTPSAFLTEAVESIVGQDLAGCKIQLRIFLHDDGSSIAETLGVLAEYEKNTALYVCLGPFSVQRPQLHRKN